MGTQLYAAPNALKPRNFFAPGRAATRSALEQLTPRVYDELRRIAGHFMQDERPGRTIQTTALVHEAYLKLIDVTNVDWQHRAHFFAISAQIMRRILLDQARRRVAAKRGGAAPRVNLDEVPDIGSGRARELIALDDALNALAKVDPRKARGHRIALLRRAQCGRDRGGAESLVRHRHAGLESWRAPGF